MNTTNVTRKSKRLSWLLRHGASEAGLEMDAAGWTDVADVCRRLHISRHTLEEVARRNNKRRIQIVGQRVRCCQGHSTEGMPVTQQALEDSWQLWIGTEWIWHGTNIKAAEGIAVSGIESVSRTHVHLAPSRVSVVGKRATVQLMLAIDPQRARDAGFPIFAAPNGVLLTRRVPVSAIVGVEARSQKGRRVLAVVAAQLGAAVLTGTSGSS